MVDVVTGPWGAAEARRPTPFLSRRIATAHEADVQAAAQQGTAGRRRETALSLKDLEPDPFEANGKGKHSSKPWSGEPL